MTHLSTNHLSEIQIDKAALRHNLARMRTLTPADVHVAAVVKGNAYGHGLEEVVRAVDGHVDLFQVDDVAELAALRKVTATRTMVLGYIPRHSVGEAVALRAELGVWDLERLPLIQRAGDELDTKVKVHVEVDSLLGRLGVMPSQLRVFLEEVSRYPSIEIVGVYSHFANIEDTTDLVHAHDQAALHHEAVDTARAFGWPNVRGHISATSGMMTIEQEGRPNELVRLGIGLYGMYPSGALERRYKGLNLVPAFRWVSHLAQVKTLPARHPVGYGLTFIARREMRVGIVPQGYSDGYDRGLSNIGEVLVRGIRCPVIGRIAMNMFAIDLDAVPEAVPEDEVVLLGEQGNDRVSAEELASRTGTINYEVTTRVSSLLPRTLIAE